MAIKNTWIAKLRKAKINRPMTIFFLVLLGIIVVCSILFCVALLRVSLDDKDFWLKVFSAVLGSLIFVIGIAALVTSHLAGQAQAEKFAELRRRQEPRQLDKSAFVRAATADGFDPRTATGVMVVYQANDPEAYEFAVNIQQALVAMVWNVHDGPRELLPQAGSNPSDAGRPALARAGGGAGITITPPTRFAAVDEIRALERGFAACGFEVKRGRPVSDDWPLTVLVGPRP